MIKQYFEPAYPGEDGRKHIPQDEIVAALAAKIIRNADEDLIYYAKKQGLTVPTPNKSARIEKRERTDSMGSQRVYVRGSTKFFEQVATFSQELAKAGF